MVYFIKYFFLIKKLIFIILIIYFFNNKFFLRFAPKNVFINEKKVYFSKYLPLKNILLEKNNSLLEIEKKYILSFFCHGKCQNNRFINKLFITSNFNFGNILVLLNKLIFYCEIIGCKNIILDKKNFGLLITRFKFQQKIYQ